MSARKPVVEAQLLLSDFEPNETSEGLSGNQIAAIINMTYWRAIKMRSTGTWSPDEEAAFLNGALAVFFATRMAEKIPACWYFGTKGSAGLLDSLLRWKREGKRLRAKSDGSKAPRRVRRKEKQS